MWQRSFWAQCTIHPHFLRSLLLQKCLRKINTRSLTFMPSPSTLRKSAALENGERQKQMVVKKIECPDRGRKMIEIYPPPFLMESQSTLLPGPERIRASGIVDNPEKFLDSLGGGVETVCDALLSGLNKSSTGECLGFRYPPKVGEYNWISYSEVVQRKNHIGSGLINLGLEPSQKTMIGICTKTRPEFVLTMMACSNYSMVLVPLYNCFGREAISHIISQVDMEAVICETPELAAGIIKDQEKYPKLKHIILIDDDEDELKNSGSRFNIITFKELEASGKLHERKGNKPKADDVFCLCYTSGTTGRPKGVVVSHRNVLSCIASLTNVLSDAVSNDTLICYLPCAHIYEIINEIFCLQQGGRLGFYSGTTEGLLDDMQKLKPEVVPLVPKLMNLIHSAVRKQIVPFPLKRRLFQLALLQKQKELRRGIARKNTVWDKLIFSKIQERLGGRAKLIFSSSAPVCKEVMQFFRCSMGCLVFEVYGLSEVGASVMTLMSEDDTGFVGVPLPCNHIKLASIPELSYLAEDDVGEICIRGANVFKGYYKNADATKEVFDEDGWYHTGDIGRWNPNGTLSIIDRKKHLFKLSQGEYIVPERSEGVYMQSPIVSQIYVDGDPNQDFIVGIVVPDKNLFVRWAKKKGFPEMDFETLCQIEDVKRAVLTHLLKLGRKKDLNSLHQVGNVYLTPEPFSVENGLLTPTLKVKRSVARKSFESYFEKLYEEGNLRKLQGL